MTDLRSDYVSQAASNITYRSGLAPIKGQNTYLEDEEAVVVQVDALALEQRRHLRERAVLTIDHVLGAVVAVGAPAHHLLGSRDRLEVLVVLQNRSAF